jgi:hypothetical protein
MIVTIHQPEHWPWLGFFNKISLSESLIILDNVQYRKRYFQNRNKIRIKSTDGWMWLTVPVLVKGKYDQAINEVLINNDDDWRASHLKAIEMAYAKSPYLPEHLPFLRTLYAKPWEKLVDLNLEIIRYMMTCLGLKQPVQLASDMGPFTEAKSDLILALCQKAGAKKYISGAFGEDYLDKEKFQQAGIDVFFQDFHHPTYPQRFEPFIPGMSSLDLLLNTGPGAGDIIHGKV